MGKVTGFLEYERKTATPRDPKERLKDYQEVYKHFTSKEVRTQAARCMDCGVPTCHSHYRGCPVNNLIPEWNHLVYENRFEDASLKLALTNNFPDITGRICPAPCEDACILGITNPPVTIKTMEKKIADRAWDEERIQPVKPARLTGKKIAVVGSGPAGMAVAQQLTRSGHTVTVYEKSPKPGGLLRYGIPDFKLEKSIVDRNIQLMEEEGTKFVCNTTVGKDITITKLKEENDAVILAGGSEHPRDLPVEGRHLKGIHFAMDFLPLQNRIVDGEKIPKDEMISAKDKNVVIIGGGDTGADCLGTSLRQGAKQVVQLEIMPKPPKPRRSTSHDEGGERKWAVETIKFTGAGGQVKKLLVTEVKWKKPKPGERPTFERVAGSEFEVDADLVLLAMGYVHPVHQGMIEELGCELTDRGNVKVDGDYMTSVPGVFACGDMERGQSLVVWAIRSGRECAREVDRFLMGSTVLP